MPALRLIVPTDLGGLIPRRSGANFFSAIARGRIEKTHRTETLANKSYRLCPSGQVQIAAN
jgi:hypothetical protein